MFKIKNTTVAALMFISIMLFGYSALSITNISSEQSNEIDDRAFTRDTFLRLKNSLGDYSDNYYEIVLSDIETQNPDSQLTIAEREEKALRASLKLENGIIQFFRLFANDFIRLGWMEGSFEYNYEELTIDFETLRFTDPQICNIQWFDTDQWYLSEQTGANGERFYEMIQSTNSREVEEADFGTYMYEALNNVSTTGILEVDFDFNYIRTTYLDPMDESIAQADIKINFHDININLLTIVTILLGFFLEFDNNGPWKLRYYLLSIILVLACLGFSIYAWNPPVA